MGRNSGGTMKPRDGWENKHKVLGGHTIKYVEKKRARVWLTARSTT